MDSKRPSFDSGTLSLQTHLLRDSLRKRIVEVSNLSSPLHLLAATSSGELASERAKVRVMPSMGISKTHICSTDIMEPAASEG